jgi:hypothetical protein
MHGCRLFRMLDVGLVATENGLDENILGAEIVFIEGHIVKYRFMKSLLVMNSKSLFVARLKSECTSV